MYLLAVILVLALLGFMVWASSDIGSSVYMKVLCRGAVREKVVALTFDDGPEDMTLKVLDCLDSHGVKAAFFMVGSKIVRHPDIVRRIVAGGHIAANHTWSHSSTFPLMPVCRMTDEILSTNQQISLLTGKGPVFFRPPFGVTNPLVASAVRSTGMTAIGWSIRSLDTIQKWPREKILRRICKRLSPGTVILLHDRCKDADKLLEMLLECIEKEGYRVVSIEELFGAGAYMPLAEHETEKTDEN